MLEGRRGDRCCGFADVWLGWSGRLEGDRLSQRRRQVGLSRHQPGIGETLNSRVLYLMRVFHPNALLFHHRIYLQSLEQQGQTIQVLSYRW
jgi:hypothetical protein